MQTDSKNVLIRLFDSVGIPYSIVEHQEIHTLKEGESLNLPHPEAIARNLFLCDDKRGSYFLVSAPQERNRKLP